MIVNNALRVARKNDMMVKGESMKIIHRMLNLAKEVGIHFDPKILPSAVDESSVKKVVKRVTESFAKGTPVKIAHDNGRVMHGLVDGIHGSVVAVKHGNNRVTYNHNYKIAKSDGKKSKDTPTFSDMRKSLETLGANQNMDADTVTSTHKQMVDNSLMDN